MSLLKQSTSANISFFMTNAADNTSGLTGATVTVTISSNGGAFGSGGGSVTEIGNGWYYYAATSGDTATLGDFLLHATATGADPTDLACQVCVDLPGATVSSVTGSVGSVSGAISSVTTVGSVTGNVGGNVVGSVGSVAGNVGGNVVGSVGSVVATVAANLTQILGTALTETSGQIAAAFKQFFNISSPTSTMNRITLVDTATAVGSVSGAVASVTGNVGGNVTGSVGSVAGNVSGSVASVVGNVGGNVVGSVGSVVATVAANLTQILGTALTETAGQIAAGFKKFFNVASPTSTMNEITLVDTTTTAGSVTGAVGSVTGNVGGSVASVVGLTASNLDATITSRATQASVSSIQNNTNFVGIVPSSLVLPDSGTKTYQMLVRLFNESGSPADPDSNIINISIKKMDGTVVVASTAMTKDATGQYHYDYVINSTDTSQPLNVFFAYAISSVAYNQVRTTEVTPYESDLNLLLARLTSQRASNLDNLDAAISTRLPTSGYTAPDNADILLIKAKTDNLPSNPASQTNLDVAVSTRLATAGYTAPNNSGIAAIKVVTDQFSFTNGNVNANSIVVEAQVEMKKNAAVADFTFPMVDSAGNPLTGATVTVQRSIDGGTLADAANAASEIGGGLYKINLAASDLNGGIIGFVFSATSAKTIFLTVRTQA